MKSGFQQHLEITLLWNTPSIIPCLYRKHQTLHKTKSPYSVKHNAAAVSQTVHEDTAITEMNVTGT